MSKEKEIMELLSRGQTEDFGLVGTFHGESVEYDVGDYGILKENFEKIPFCLRWLFGFLKSKGFQWGATTEYLLGFLFRFRKQQRRFQQQSSWI
jgi:hypothetical protein